MNDVVALYWRAFSLIVLVIGFQVAAAQFHHFSREAKRRWQHAITGHALVVISYYLPQQWCVVALVAAAFGLWFLRTFHSNVYVQQFGPLLRPHELEGQSLPGAFYFLLGAAVVAGLFPIGTARYAVECLSWADPMAAWAGQSIPSLKITSSASVIGCCACFATAWIIGFYMLKEEEEEAPWVVITLGAFACCVAEAFPWGNDNLLIPITTASCVELAQSTHILKSI